MRLVFLGPPGSGKGTYASRIAPKLGILHVASGDLLREIKARGGKLGAAVASYIDKGQLVPDDMITEIIKKRLQDCQGFILDGYPRNLAQAKALDKFSKIDAVINLDVTEEVIMQRLGGRRICRSCSKIFNIYTLKPKRPGVCDDCGGELYQRDDDREEVIRERLKIYRELTEPLIKYYAGRGVLKTVSCTKADIPPTEVIKKIYEVLGLEPRI